MVTVASALVCQRINLEAWVRRSLTLNYFFSFILETAYQFRAVDSRLTYSGCYILYIYLGGEGD